MIELVIVVVIIGIITAIAVPRFEGMTDRAKGQRAIGDLGTLQRAAELYTVEHGGDNPGINPDGSAVAAPILIARMISTTHDDGTINASGIFGPYIREIPENVVNGRRTVRVDGEPPGAGTHGWHFDTSTGNFASDVKYAATRPDGTVVDHTGDTVSDINALGNDVVRLGG